MLFADIERKVAYEDASGMFGDTGVQCGLWLFLLFNRLDDLHQLERLRRPIEV